MVWYGTVRCGTVWYGMEWYGMVWYGIAPVKIDDKTRTCRVFLRRYTIIRSKGLEGDRGSTTLTDRPFYLVYTKSMGYWYVHRCRYIWSSRRWLYLLFGCNYQLLRVLVEACDGL